MVVTEFEHSRADADKYYKGKRGGPVMLQANLDEAKTLRKNFELAIDGYSFRGHGRVTIARIVFENIPIDLLMTELARQDEVIEETPIPI